MTHSPNLADKLRSGETVVSAWVSLPSPWFAHLFMQAGYEAITLDMQHGLLTSAETREAVQTIVRGSGHAVVRVCVDDFPKTSWMLDAGAEAVIAPMINSKEAAERLADFCKYPPIGERSYGAFGVTQLSGESIEDYFASGNENTLCFAMIETPEAVEALDDILSVDGLDGIFVGPSDLSLTVAQGGRVEPIAEASLKMQRMIAEKTTAAGKIAGIYCCSRGHVQQSKASGYRFMTYGSDASLFVEGARATLESVK